jgi:hypothetical protein
MDHLCLTALAFLPEIQPAHLGSLAWSLGKLGTVPQAARIHEPVSFLALFAVDCGVWLSFSLLACARMFRLLVCICFS